MKTTLPVLLAGLIALAAPACGADEPVTTGTDDQAAAAEEAAVAFAACMREHGVEIADPGPGGVIIVDGDDALADPEVQAEAEAACAEEREALQGGSGQAPAVVPDALVEMAACLRAAGFDVPDPETGPGGRVTAAVDPDLMADPEFQEAQRRCRADAGLPAPDAPPSTEAGS